ncbi:MAG: Phenazine biosynthesis protein PhzF like, partial [uncultured Craurococcus sp.]
ENLPLRHARRLHRPPLRWQPARRLSRCAGPLGWRDAVPRHRVQSERDHLRPAPRGPGEHRPCPHLQPHRRDALRRPPQCRDGPCPRRPGTRRPAPLRAAGRAGRDPGRARPRRRRSLDDRRRPAAASHRRGSAPRAHRRLRRHRAGGHPHRPPCADHRLGWRQPPRPARGDAGGAGGGRPRPRRLPPHCRDAARAGRPPHPLPLPTGWRAPPRPHVLAPGRHAGGCRHRQRRHVADRVPAFAERRRAPRDRHHPGRRDGPPQPAPHDGSPHACRHPRDGRWGLRPGPARRSPTL